MGEFQSEAQRRMFHAMEGRGEMPAAEVEKWERETSKAKKKRLPMHVKESSGAGAGDALARFKVAAGFFAGQREAATDLIRNLRGGLGGAMNPRAGDLSWLAQENVPAMRQLHRQAAMHNVRQLLPTLAAGAGLYALHKRHQDAANPATYAGPPQYAGSYDPSLMMGQAVPQGY